MKKKRMLMAAVCVLVLLCGAYALLSNRGPDTGENSETEALDLGSGNGAVSLTVEPAGGEPYTILVRDEAEGSRSLWLEGYDQSMAIDANEAGKLLSSLETLKAYGEVEGDPQDYGIGPDSSRATLVYEGGTERIFVFGNQTPVARRSYVQDAEREKIYVIRQDIAQLCQRPVEALRKVQLAADFFGTEEAFAADQIEILPSQGEPMTIRRQTQEETDASPSDAPAIYRMEQPVVQECADGKVNSDIVAACLALDGQGQVIEDFPEDLSRYGLAEGYSEIQIQAQGLRFRLLIGKETGDGLVYAMRQDIPSVAAVPDSVLNILNLKWYDLINPSIWMRSIDKIASVSVEAPDASWTLVLERSGQGAVSGGTLNGVTISEEELRNIYMKVLDIHIEGRLEDGEGGRDSASQEDGPSYRIVLRRLDGKEEGALFYKVDARRYAIEGREGLESGFYTGAGALSELEQALEAAL